MIDSDMSWTVEDFAGIALSKYDVITGVVSLGENKYNIAKRLIGEEPWGYYMPYKYYEVDKREPFEVDACGTAFMSINPQVFLDIKSPWFEFYQPKIENEEYSPRTIGEDYVFSEKIKKAGYSIYADPRIKPGHLKTEAKY